MNAPLIDPASTATRPSAASLRLHPVVAVDGTAASGKSTVARAVAARLGYSYVNTGLMYRAVTWRLLDVPDLSSARVTEEIENWNIECRLEGDETVFLVNGEDPMPFIRDARVNDKVSTVAAVPAVRTILTALQRALAEQAPVVMEGRDIGTAVFPGTPYKFYIDADPAVREQRRRAQGEQDSITRRDAQDSARVVAPLTCAPDAVVIDSGQFTADEVVEQVLAKLRELGLRQ